MTNDFQLFADPDDGEGPLDTDVALISAYLARELSPMQLLAIEERLASDAEFRASMQPLIDGWAAPVAALEGGAARRVAPLSTLERSESWQRFQREVPIVVPRGRRKTVIRIAATIAAIALPVAGLAQLVVYAATHSGAPGHAIARSIVPVSVRLSDAKESQTLSLPSGEQQGVPLVDLTTPTARTTRTFGAIVGFKETSDGRVLVDDYRWRQLYLLDKTLALVTVPLDSVPGSAKYWGGANFPGFFIPYVGDSALIMDPGGQHGMRVLDATGKVVRALALGIADDMAWPGTQLFDPKGRAVFATPAENMYRFGGGNDRGWKTVSLPVSAFIPRPPSATAVVSGRGGNADADPSVRVTTYVDRADSVAIVRADLDAGRVDTIGYFTLPLQGGVIDASDYGDGRVVIGYGADGRPVSIHHVINPLVAIDTWTLLSDGTIAIVRGHDYHVDWIRPDGSRSASPKLPYDWKALTDADKQRLVDSTRACIDSVDAWAPAATEAQRAAIRARRGGAGLVPSGSPVPPRPACFAPPRNNRSPDDTEIPSQPRSIRYEIVPLAQIADYSPPFRQNAAVADRDGNVWILPRMTALAKQGALVYDVVNPERGLVRRVRLPAGRSIAGFGKDGVVYLQLGNLTDGFTLERYVVAQ